MSTAKYLRIAALLLAFAVAPVAISFTSALIASLLGCSVDEGLPHQCLVFGVDLGAMFYMLGTFFWFMMFTIPIAAIGLICVAVMWVVATFRRRGSGTGPSRSAS